jgi:hypothetical protein
MRKDIIITALLTFCLTATLFMIATTRSQEYNPWADINADGKIDILDVVGTTGIYGMSGDPTKNVTIAGHANKLAYSVESVLVGAGLDFYTPYISVDGYSKMTICLTTYSNNWNCYIFCGHPSGAEWFTVDQISGSIYSFSKTYDVPNQEVMIRYANGAAVTIPISIDVYLIP